MADQPAQILVLASDDATRQHLVELLSARSHVLEVASDAATALALVERATPDVLLLQLELSDEADVDLLRRVRKLAEHATIVALTTDGSVDTVVEAIKQGADHCLALPVRHDAVEVVVARALRRPLLARQAAEARHLAAERLDLGQFDRLVGAHPTMQRLLNKAFQAAKSRATVLVCGETGTGKELIAAAIHQNSKRARCPFVTVNCATLAETLLESELFGHEKGAFTGAAMRRKGRFEQADQGTLFLDEVSEIPAAVQVKLLRFLQEREFERVGGDETVRVDVRVVAATNRDLKALADERLFREDLYYRLNVVRLDVPPLRTRPSDVPALADYFLRRYAEENEKDLTGFSDAAHEALLMHPWPGNVRELQNMIEQAVVLCEGEEIDVEDLPIQPDPAEDEPLRLMIPGITLAELERYAILKTLEAVGGSPTKAANILGVSRRTIQYRMREWGVAARAKGNASGEAQAPDGSSADGASADGASPAPPPAAAAQDDRGDSAS